MRRCLIISKKKRKREKNKSYFEINLKPCGQVVTIHLRNALKRCGSYAIQIRPEVRKKKSILRKQGSQDPPRKKQNFRNEEDFILTKKPPKKKFFPPQQAVVARFARASLTATERRGGSILRDNKKRKSNPFSCTIRSTNRTKPIRLPEAGADATAGNFKKTAKVLQLWSSCIFWLQNARVSKDISNSIFLRSKKININGAAGEKKLGYSVRMLPFTPQNHSTNPFFE